jgi:hypothetical protein
MKRIDQKDFDLSNTRSKSTLPASVFERPDVDSPIRNSRSLLESPLFRFAAIAVAAILVLSLLYSLLVPPMVRLNIRLANSENFEMQLKASTFGETASVNIRVDGNLFAIRESDSNNFIYYKQEGNALYKYVNDASGGRWVKEDTRDEYQDSIAFDKMLNPHNYERVEGSLLHWKIKDDVDLGRITDVTASKIRGKFAITWNQGAIYYTLTFVSFGRTPLDPENDT